MVLKLYWNTTESGHEKTCLMSNANNKGADHPVHRHSLISAFVFRCLDSVMSPVSVAEQASFSLTSSELPEDTFSHDEAQF